MSIQSLKYTESAFSQNLSPLSLHLVDTIILKEKPYESKSRKIIRISLYGFGAISNYGRLIPNINIALQLEGGLPLKVATVLGVSSFGALGTKAFCEMIDEIMSAPSIKEEKTNCCFTALKIVKLGTTFFVALICTMPSGGVSLVVSPNIPFGTRLFLATISVLGRTWTTWRSVYGSVEYVKNVFKDQFNTNEIDRHTNIIKGALISCIDISQEGSLPLTKNERREFFATLLLKPSTEEKDFEEDQMDDKKIKIQDLFKEIITFAQDRYHPNNLENLIAWPKRVVTVLSIIPPILLMIQNALLMKASFDVFIAGLETVKWVSSAFIASSFTWLGLKYCAESAGTLFERLITILCWSDRKKNFGETFYPKLTILLQIVALVLSALPYAELIAVARHFVNPNTWYGRFFMEGNFAASFLLAFVAIESLFIETIIRRISESRLSSEEIQEAAAVIREIKNLKESISNRSQSDFRDLLKDLGEDNLNKLIKDTQIGLTQLQAVLDEDTKAITETN